MHASEYELLWPHKERMSGCVEKKENRGVALFLTSVIAVVDELMSCHAEVVA